SMATAHAGKLTATAQLGGVEHPYRLGRGRRRARRAHVRVGPIKGEVEDNVRRKVDPRPMVDLFAPPGAPNDSTTVLRVAQRTHSGAHFVTYTFVITGINDTLRVASAYIEPNAREVVQLL